MGKTSLVRELLRRLDEDGAATTVFVDLEGANDPADAVAEIAIQAKSIQSAWKRIGDALRITSGTHAITSMRSDSPTGE